MKKSLFLVAFIFLVGLFFPIHDVYATCTNGPSLPCGLNTPETCTNGGGGSGGTAVYSCGTYCNDVTGVCSSHCYCHTFTCNTSCGGGGPAAGCSAECKRGTSCGSGYSSSGGCGTCKKDQFGNSKVCCKKQGSCGGAPPAPACNTTAATGLTFTRNTVSTATLSWTTGSNGVNQYLFVGANPTEVTNNCPGTGSPACIVKNTTLPANTFSYPVSGLTAGTVYYWKLVTVKSASCSTAATGPTTISSCGITPSSVSMPLFSTQVLTSAAQSSGTITNVTFSSANPTLASVSPASDNTFRYQTTITGNQDGTTSVTSNVLLNGVINCTTVTPVTITPPASWWQVQDSDLVSSGDIISQAPTGKIFGLDGPGGYPGVVAYGGVYDFSDDPSSTGIVSSKSWLASSATTSTRNYDAAFFMNQIPADTVITTVPSSSVDGSYFESGGTESYGYYWYKYDGSLNGVDFTINTAMDLGDRKVILIVNAADINLSGNINLNDGHGFFMAIAGQTAAGAKGKINVNPLIGGGVGPNLEGIYLTDNGFLTGTSTPSLDIPLKIRGSVASVYGSVSLQRTLGDIVNLTTPAEFFEFAPDQLMLFPSKLGVRRINWKEVAP